VANGRAGILAAGTAPTATPEVARRTWPQWLALGIGMIAVAAAVLVWDAVGARLLLTAIGGFLAVRGALLLRGARSGAMSRAVAARARTLGATALIGGVAAGGVAQLSDAVAARVLLVAVPVLLLAGAGALLGRGGTARRGGLVLLVWALPVTGVLLATGFAQGWARASEVATVVAALAVAVLAVPLLVAAAGLRTVAATPAPAPARPAACAGCACGAGGCGS